MRSEVEDAHSPDEEVPALPSGTHQHTSQSGRTLSSAAGRSEVKHATHIGSDPAIERTDELPGGRLEAGEEEALASSGGHMLGGDEADVVMILHSTSPTAHLRPRTGASSPWGNPCLDGL